MVNPLFDPLALQATEERFSHRVIPAVTPTTHARAQTVVFSPAIESAQYCSNYYQAIHQRHGLVCSMTDGYDCHQNALAERVNGILKGALLLQRPAGLEQARRMVRESVQIYNGERPHLSLKMQTPDAVHRASLADICRLKSSSQVST